MLAVIAGGRHIIYIVLDVLKNIVLTRQHMYKSCKANILNGRCWIHGDQGDTYWIAYIKQHITSYNGWKIFVYHVYNIDKFDVSNILIAIAYTKL